MAREDINRALAGIGEIPSVNDEWMIGLNDLQQRQHDEIVMMVHQLSDHGYRINYSLREYDMKHFVILEGDKCYGQAPKVHAYLSGAYAVMDWSRSNDESN